MNWIRPAVLGVGVYMVATAVMMDSYWLWPVLFVGGVLLGVYDAMRSES